MEIIYLFLVTQKQSSFIVVSRYTVAALEPTPNGSFRLFCCENQFSGKHNKTFLSFLPSNSSVLLFSTDKWRAFMAINCATQSTQMMGSVDGMTWQWCLWLDFEMKTFYRFITDLLTHRADDVTSKTLLRPHQTVLPAEKGKTEKGNFGDTSRTDKLRMIHGRLSSKNDDKLIKIAVVPLISQYWRSPNLRGGRDVEGEERVWVIKRQISDLPFYQLFSFSPWCGWNNEI